MKRVILFMAVAAALIVASVTAANAVDVSSQAVVGAPVTVISTVTPGPETVSCVVTVTANVGPKLQITLPPTVDFGNVLPGDTGTTNYDVVVKSTRDYTIARAIAANQLGVYYSTALPGGSVASREATYTETVGIDVGWAAQGANNVPVTYTVIW